MKSKLIKRTKSGKSVIIRNAVAIIASLALLLVGTGIGFLISSFIERPDVKPVIVLTEDKTDEKIIEIEVKDDVENPVNIEEPKTDEITSDTNGEKKVTEINTGKSFNVSDAAKVLANEYGIKFSILMGLMKTESGFNPNAVSGTNDYGICQINSINHQYLMTALGLTDIMDPIQNMRCGAFMLSNLYKNYPDYTDHMILMAYNMGPTGAKRAFEVGQWTSKYSNKVLANASEFENANEDVIVKY